MKLAIITFGLAVLLFNPIYSFAEGEKTEKAAENEAHSKFCPVCGPSDEMEGLSVTYKYEGKKYSFCSLDCMKAFKKNPEAYLNDKQVDKDK